MTKIQSIADIHIDENNVFTLEDHRTAHIKKLIDVSHQKFMDVDSVIPWKDGINKNLLPKTPETSWIYGTPYWDELTEEQRKEMMWMEVARDVSMFIWLEQCLPPLYVGYVNTYKDRLSPEIYEYLMIFSKEEIIHTLMFRRFLKLGNLPLYSAPTGPYVQLYEKLPHLHPVIGILWTLTVEWAAETTAIYGTQDDAIEPLTRKMFYEHHMEELRHIMFGRRLIESFFNTASDEEKHIVRQQFKPVLSNLVNLITFNPEIVSFLSFKFPANVNDPKVIESIRNSENNQRINPERFKEQYDWYKELGIVDENETI